MADPTETAPRPGSGSAAPDLATLYAEAKDKACAVDQIFIEGNDRTKLFVIERELEGVLEASTLEEVRDAAYVAASNLQELGAFRRTEIELVASESGKVDACDMVVHVDEKDWKSLHIGTYVQGSEGTVEASAEVRNLTGNAEKVQLSAEMGSSQSVEYLARYVQPRVYGTPWHSAFTLHQVSRSHVKTSSYADRLRGGVAALVSGDKRHEVAYELAWRSVWDPSCSASATVRQQCGHKLKSSASYTFCHDARDSPLRPGEGFAVHVRTEVAGLSSDAHVLRFVKQTLSLQAATTLREGLTATVDLGVGAMIPWGGASASLASAKPSSIAERFFLGGTSTLRGFTFNSVGPSDTRRPAAAPADGGAATASAAAARDYVGGDLSANFLAALNADIPLQAAQALGIHAHAFVNGGNLLGLAGAGRTLGGSLREFGSTIRWSAGIGVVLPLPVGRLEVNYATTLSSQEHDRAKRGLQIGFAASSFVPLGRW